MRVYLLVMLPKAANFRLSREYGMPGEALNF